MKIEDGRDFEREKIDAKRHIDKLLCKIEK